MSEAKVTKDLESKTLTIEREFSAPVAKLWRAYADKESFEKWWGPEGWQTTTKTFEFKPGGKVHYAMKCVDENQGEWFGQETWGLMDITSIEEAKRFEALDHFSNAEGTVDEKMPTQKFIVEFVDAGDGKSKLVCHSVCETAEQLEELVKMGMVEGFSSQLNKLEKLLAE
jgi:uncharacterized protein YndB with AHSA1/START domain